MTGINTAMYFAPQIMVKAGIYEKNNKQDVKF
jgi:hypothetical protein